MTYRHEDCLPRMIFELRCRSKLDPDPGRQKTGSRSRPSENRIRIQAVRKPDADYLYLLIKNLFLRQIIIRKFSRIQGFSWRLIRNTGSGSDFEGKPGCRSALSETRSGSNHKEKAGYGSEKKYTRIRNSLCKAIAHFSTSQTMVLLLDGKSEHPVHV